MKIKCTKCGKIIKMKETLGFCPFCGTEIESKKENSSMKCIKARYIVTPLAILLLVCISMISIRYINKPENKFVKCLEEEQYEKAQEIYDKNVAGNTKVYDRIEDKVEELLNEVVSDYIGNEKTYESFVALKKFLSKNFSNISLSDYTRMVYKFKRSKENYQKGENELQYNKYVNAVSYYSQVLEGDGYYNDAKEKIDICKSKFKERIFQEIQSKMESENPVEGYVELIDKIEKSDLVNRDEDVLQKCNELRNKVKENALKIIETNFKSKNYFKASEYIDSIPKEFQEDADILKLKEKANNNVVKNAIKESNVFVKKQKYTDALAVLLKYEKYDNSGKIKQKRKSIKDELKKYNIKEFKKLKPKLTIHYDSVDRRYVIVPAGYSTKYVNVSENINIEAITECNKKGQTAFQLRVGFIQEDWIFTDTVKFASAKFRKNFSIGYLELYTQVLDGDISEWVYLDADDDFIQKITTPKKSTIRFSGNGTGSRDHIITASEKENIKNVRKCYNMIRSYPYLIKYL